MKQRTSDWTVAAIALLWAWTILWVSDADAQEFTLDQGKYAACMATNLLASEYHPDETIRPLFYKRYHAFRRAGETRGVTARDGGVALTMAVHWYNSLPANKSAMWLHAFECVISDE